MLFWTVFTHLYLDLNSKTGSLSQNIWSEAVRLARRPPDGSYQSTALWVKSCYGVNQCMRYGTNYWLKRFNGLQTDMSPTADLWAQKQDKLQMSSLTIIHNSNIFYGIRGKNKMLIYLLLTWLWVCSAGGLGRGGAASWRRPWPWAPRSAGTIGNASYGIGKRWDHLGNERSASAAFPVSTSLPLPEFCCYGDWCDRCRDVLWEQKHNFVNPFTVLQ